MWTLSSEQLGYTASIRTSLLNVPVIPRKGSGARTGVIRTSIVLLRDDARTDMIPLERAVSND